MLKVNHAVLARAIGVHSRAIRIESSTKSVKHFSSIIMSSMESRLIFKEKQILCIHFYKKVWKKRNYLQNTLWCLKKEFFIKTRRSSIEDIIINKKCFMLFVLDSIPKALKCTPIALDKTAWSTLSTQISELRRNFKTKFFVSNFMFVCHIRFLQPTRKV